MNDDDDAPVSELPPNTKRTPKGIVSSANEAPVPPRPEQELTLEEKVARLWNFTGPLEPNAAVNRSTPLGFAIYNRPDFGDVRDLIQQELRMESRRRTLRARVGTLLRTLADRLEFGRQNPFADLDNYLGRKVDTDEIEHEPLRTGVFG